MTKLRAGKVGLVSVVLLLAWQSLEEWSLIDAVDTKLRRLGPAGLTLAYILHSRVLVLVLAIAAIVLILRVRSETDSSLATEHIENKAESSPSVSQTASPHVEQHVHIGEKSQPEPRAELPVSLDFVQARSVLLHEGNFGVWHEASTNLGQAHRGLTAQFKSHPSPPGQQVRGADVTASLVFRSSGNDDLHVNRGAWMGVYENVVHFGPGDAHQLVIAIKDVPWITLHNPHRYNPTRGRFRSGTVVYPPEKYTIAAHGEVEITLLDVHNFTVFSGVFRYQCTADKLLLERE